MFRRILPIALLLCALPVLANAAAWFFSTQARSAGGTISSPNMTDQRVSDGPIFRSYTTGAALGLTVTADPGFSISQVTVNNVSLGAKGTAYSTTVHGMSDQSVTATFVAGHLAVNATNAGGTVTPPSVGNINYGDTLKAPLTFTFVPATGYQITGINNLPNDPKVTHSSFSPGINKAVTVKLDTGYVFKSAINLLASVENVTPSINFVLPQTVVGGGSVSLNAVAVNVPDNASYTWSYLSGPGNTAVVSSGKLTSTTSFTPGPAIAAFPATGAAATFTAPSIPGQYKFKVVVSSTGNPDLSTLAVVNVVASVYSAGRNQCQFCHSANGIGSPQLFSNWSASAHRANAVSCDKCHIGVNTGGHPGTTSGNVCAKCHSNSVDAQGNYLVENHPFAFGATICTACHDPHSTIGTTTAVPTEAHFTNLTGAGYPASYVTSRATCMDCHFNSADNATVRGQWAGSSHAAVKDAPFTAYDFKTRSGCVQCHTTTGFIAFSTAKVTAAWGVSSDKTKEVLSCVGCHSDITTGQVRSVTPVRPYADETDYQNRNVGTSNVCMNCHSGRNNGASIQVKVGSAFDLATSAFIAPHYLSAGGTLHGKSGYQFPGRTYAGYSSNSHRAIGMNNAMATGNDGPCVGCHMSSPTSHGFQPVSIDPTGAVSAITATACTNCHNTALSATTLDADRVSFNNALDVLKAQLAASLHPYSPNYPYFDKGGWGAGQAGANLMGAAFNYKLLLAEPGAYAHNSAYAKQLIVDSIDAAANNGTVTGDITSALAALTSSQAITQTQADSLNSYTSASNCASCHTNSSGSHTAHLTSPYGNQAINCSDCHNATALNNTTLVPGTAAHLTTPVDVTLAQADGGSYSAGTCSSVYCHSNGRGTYQNPTWGNGTATCSFCHQNLAGAHGVHVGNLLSSGAVTFYNFTGNYSVQSLYRFGCANCHSYDPTSHLNTHVDLSLVPAQSAGTLRFLNSTSAAISGIGNTGSGIAGTGGVSVTCSAAYCHSNGRPNGKPFSSASPDWYQPAGAIVGARGECVSCHGGVVNGFNNLSTGTHLKHVDAAGYAFGCATCHAATVFNNYSIADRSKHLNGTKDLAFSGLGAGTGWDGAGCATSACHSQGQSSYLPPNTKPVWGTQLNCTGCHNGDLASGTPMATGSHSTHLNAGLNCSDCHFATVGSPNTIKSGSITHVNGQPDVTFASGSYDAGTKTCSNVYCHSDGLANFAQIPWGQNTASAPTHLTCQSCHPTLKGAHTAHVGDLNQSVTFYNYTGNYSTGTMYRFGCANCHPMDLANHRNGQVDVTLKPDARAGTLRNKNGASSDGINASGSGIAGTTGVSVVCSASYCHSNGGAGGALAYASSPDWYNAAAYTGDRCAMCHGNAPATGAHAKHAVSIHSTAVFDENNKPIPSAASPAVSVHGDPAQATTISCNLCHSLTVTSNANDNSSSCASCHSSDPKGTPALNKAFHLNGTVEVAFQDVKVVSKAQIKPASFGKYSTVWTRSTYKAVNGSFDTAKQSLALGAYNADKSCSNISCHNGGAPKWSDRLSCVDCHSAL